MTDHKLSIITKQIAGINLCIYVSELITLTISNDHITDLFKLFEIFNHSRIKKFIFRQYRLVNHHFDTFCFYTLHHALD